MRFLHPEMASWGLLLPLFLGAWLVYRQVRVTARRRSPIAARFADLSRRSGWPRDVAGLLAALVAGAALTLALTQPQARLSGQTPDYERQDLIIMLDRSASMRAQDITPSRFSRAILEIRNFILHKPDTIDRIALVGFADASMVLSYLTPDLDSVLFYLDWIDGDQPPLFGTNMGAALNSAMNVARKDDRPTQKVFLIVSDGEDQGKELTHALDAAREANYHVDCIGIGSDRAVPIPLPGDGRQQNLLLDDAGHPVLTRFEERTLRDVAARTGGRYVRSTTGHELQEALADIVAHEQRLLGWHVSVEYRELYPLCLLVAALAAGVLWLLL
jgi:Ca-activated chloride channel homolog